MCVFNSTTNRKKYCMSALETSLCNHKYTKNEMCVPSHRHIPLPTKKYCMSVKETSLGTLGNI